MDGQRTDIGRILTQPQFIFYFVFIGLDQTHHWPSFPKFTADDANRQAAKTANLPINSSLRFGQLWENRIRGKLINIEEGVFKTWHSRRIVLVGDSAHKVPYFNHLPVPHITKLLADRRDLSRTVHP